LLKSDSAVQVENAVLFLSIPYIDALPLGYLTPKRETWIRTTMHVSTCIGTAKLLKSYEQKPETVYAILENYLKILLFEELFIKRKDNSS